MFELGFADNLKNHLGTFHASAQYAQAEACSGYALQNHFLELVNSVVPVLRKSEAKFKKAATTSLKARAEIAEDSANTCKQQLEKKGRAIISVPVEIIDQDGNVTMVGIYQWFVQKI